MGSEMCIRDRFKMVNAFVSSYLNNDPVDVSFNIFLFLVCVRHHVKHLTHMNSFRIHDAQIK